MPTLIERIRLLAPAARAERRNIESLAARLGVSIDDAAWIHARSREVGFGAAMTEYEARCREAPPLC